jgi:predicted RNase H-like HicB family nuclease
MKVEDLGWVVKVDERRKDMRRFLIIIEKGSHNYSAYVPDLPGCIATGKTVEEVKANMREAIKMHLEGMMEYQESIPPSQTMAEYVDIAIPDSAA